MAEKEKKNEQLRSSRLHSRLSSPKQPENALKCPTCGNTTFYEDTVRGELVCRRCGTVIEEAPPIVPEWKEREAAGPSLGPTTRGKGLSTEIGGLAGVPLKERGKFLRLRAIDRWITRSRDKTMMTALSEIRRQTAYLALPISVQEEATALFDRLLSAGKVKGWSTEELVTGILFAVAKRRGYPRTIDEFAAASELSERDIRKAYRHVSRLLDMKITPARPEDYVSRFGTLLGLSGRVQGRANEILGKIPGEVALGKSPIGIAAAALYIASVLLNERRSEKDISEAIGISEPTIRLRVGEIVKALGMENEVQSKLEEK